MESAVHATVEQSLQSVDQRYTRSRREIVDALQSAGRPLTVAELIGAVEGLVQSSAYRNLTVLERAGTVRRVQGADDFARYELAEHLTDHHHHLICTDCGAIADVRMSARLEGILEGALSEVRTETGFAPSAHRLDLVGRCAACQRA